MRSLGEIAFRFRQEAGNVWLGFTRPSPRVLPEAPLEGLPEPSAVVDRVRGTGFAREVEELAGAVLEHRIPIFGREVTAGPRIHWRRDYVSGRESGTGWFRLVPYLDFSRVGDHKVVWELNRHQHLVLLAQVWRLTGRSEYLEEIRSQLVSWLEDNPFLRGINWASALEVAFRALSWTWVYHLAGESMEEPFRRALLTELYRHGCYIERNLSVYFSPNTHLLGESVALHALGRLIPVFPRAERWRRMGADLVERQMARQVRNDGSHFEQSTYYHVYALDMFLLHRCISKVSEQFDQKLRSMAVYLATLIGKQGSLPMLGDEDGGRWFHPYGPREAFGRATLATCGVLLGHREWIGQPEDLHEQGLWWLGPQCLEEKPSSKPADSRLFPEAGVAIMAAGDARVAADAGPLGAGSGGHSHSDTLSLVAWRGGEEILIDPGTYTYVPDGGLRDWFRGSAAHNSVRVNRRDQATPAGPFRWLAHPSARVHGWTSSGEMDFLDAECRYGAFVHRRRFLLLKIGLLFVQDEIDGPDGEHLIEQFWHLGRPAVPEAPGCWRVGSRSRLLLPPDEGVQLLEGDEHGWRSHVYGSREPAPVIIATRRSELPATLWAAVDFAGAGSGPVVLAPGGGRFCALCTDSGRIAVRFPSSGLPGVTIG